MKIIIADCETDGLEYTKMHCVSLKWYKSPKIMRFTDMEDFEDYIATNKPDKWVFHNGLHFDVHAINNLTRVSIDPRDVIDTQVVSKLVDYSKFKTHSLRELGLFLGVHKGDFEGPWDVYTEKMGKYCDQDVEVLSAIFDYYHQYIFDPTWAKAMRVEHDIALECYKMEKNGFGFNKFKAIKLLDEVEQEMEKLEESFQKEFGERLEHTKTLKLKYTKDGKLFNTVTRAMADYPKVELDHDKMEVRVFEYKKFNPGSPKDRIDMLWEAGWKPVDKTKGYKSIERKS